MSGVAHELNNPLAAIIAFSQLLRSDERLPDDMKHDAGLLVQEADRTRRIVANLLDFARARPPERQPTSIAVLVQSVLELQSYALNTNKIQVKVEIPTTLPLVDLDRAQLQQVLLNLTINAIQALRGRDRKTPGHLWVTAAMVNVRSSAATGKGDKLADEAGRVRITIQDDGPGVPESARPRLFDPFFTTKQPGEGTGLGLSVSFGIVAAHRGLLWYEPGPGGIGSDFILELPVSAQGGEGARGDIPGRFGDRTDTAASGRPSRREPGPVAPPRSGVHSMPTAATAAASTSGTKADQIGAGAGEAAIAARAGADPTPKATPSSIAGSAPGVPATPAAEGAPVDAEKTPAKPKPRILALDDEPSIRAFLRTALTRHGMDCQPFPDGAHALEGLREATFDVMLIDHRMPLMSGTEFYEAAVAFRPEMARRAIFMSGDTLNPDLRGFATQRGIRLLRKPFDISEVIGIVHEALESSRSGDG